MREGARRAGSLSPAHSKLEVPAMMPLTDGEGVPRETVMRSPHERDRRFPGGGATGRNRTGNIRLEGGGFSVKPQRHGSERVSPLGPRGKERYGRGTRPWSRMQGSNPRPTDYKSAALPSELNRQVSPCAIQHETAPDFPSVPGRQLTRKELSNGEPRELHPGETCAPVCRHAAGLIDSSSRTAE